MRQIKHVQWDLCEEVTIDSSSTQEDLRRLVGCELVNMYQGNNLSKYMTVQPTKTVYIHSVEFLWGQSPIQGAFEMELSNGMLLYGADVTLQIIPEETNVTE